MKHTSCRHMDILLANNVPVTHWGRKARLVFNPKSLSDLRWLASTKKIPNIDIKFAKPVVRP